MPITIDSTLNSITSYTSYDNNNNKLDSCTFSSLKLGDDIVITLNGTFKNENSGALIEAYVYNNIIKTSAEITALTPKVGFSNFLASLGNLISEILRPSTAFPTALSIAARPSSMISISGGN